MDRRTRWVTLAAVMVVALMLFAGRNSVRGWLTGTPRTAQQYKEVAIKALGQMQVGDAITALKQAVVLEPTSAELHYLLAQALETSGRREEAVREYLNTVTLSPAMASPRYNLAVIYRLQGEYDAMEEQLNKALEAAPDFSAAHLLLGTLCYDRGEWERAISELSLVEAKGSTVVSDPIAFHRMLAKSATALGRKGEAAEHWRAILALDPNDSEASMN